MGLSLVRGAWFGVRMIRHSLVPSPTPSFSSLLSTVLSSDEKLGVGLGTRLDQTCIIYMTVT